MNITRRLGSPRKRVVQPAGSCECAVAVACMIVGCELEQAHAWMGTEPGEPWHDGQVQLFLLNSGVSFNMGIGLIEPDTCFPNDILQRDMTFEGQPGYVSVNGSACKRCAGPEGPLQYCEYCDTTGFMSHAVYWDGSLMWDPSPYVDGPQFLQSYVVRDFWALDVFTIEQTVRLRKALGFKNASVSIFFDDTGAIYTSTG